MYTLHKFLASLSAFLVLTLFLPLVTPSRGYAGTDSDLFKKGVTSFQKNRFPEAIGSLTQLLQAHPKTPLRDMTLYYLARSHLKSGQQDKAAAVTAQLMREFPASYNKGTIDAELLRALEAKAQVSAVPARRGDEGKKLPTTSSNVKKVPAAHAPHLRKKEELTSGTGASVKPQKPRLPTRQAAQEKKVIRKAKTPARPLPVPPVRKPAEIINKELSPEKTDQPPTRPLPSDSTQSVPDVKEIPVAEYASIVGKGTPPFDMQLTHDWVMGKVGSTVSIPFTISNAESKRIHLRLSSEFPPFFLPRFTAAGSNDTREEISIEPQSSYSGVLSLLVPSASTDGARFSYRIEALSSAHGNVAVSREAGIIASAPMLRAVIKARPDLSADGNVTCTVTLLNAGSATAEDVSMKLVYAPLLEPVDESKAAFMQEEGALVRNGVRLEPGGLLEFVTSFRTNGSTGQDDPISFRIDLMDRRLGTGASVRSAAADLENDKQD